MRSGRFERYAKKQGKTQEQVLSDWLEGVRKDGLPRLYKLELEGAGANAARIQKHREWLEGADPAEAVRTLEAFVRQVAPLHVADARGEPKAPAGPPDEDDLWDLAAIAMLEAAAEGN